MQQGRMPAMTDPGRDKRRRIVRLFATRAALPIATALAVPRLRSAWAGLPILELATWMVAEALAENEVANQIAGDSTQDRGTRHLMVGSHMIAWWAPLVEGGARSAAPPSRTALAVGTIVTLAGAAMRISAVRTLGKDFTGYVHVKQGQPVCETGLYRHIRHPSYVGLFFLNVGPSITLRAWWSVPVVAACTAAAVTQRVRAEEDHLVGVIGQPYAVYLAATPRFIPAPLRRLQNERR